jgi:hypothetical protein
VAEPLLAVVTDLPVPAEGSPCAELASVSDLPVASGLGE